MTGSKKPLGGGACRESLRWAALSLTHVLSLFDCCICKSSSVRTKGNSSEERCARCELFGKKASSSCLKLLKVRSLVSLSAFIVCAIWSPFLVYKVLVVELRVKVMLPLYPDQAITFRY